MTVAIHTERLGRRYRRRWALRDRSVELPSERVIGLVGPNGVDRAGHPVQFAQLTAICPAPDGHGASVACAIARGFQQQATYQRLSRFWPLQGIESAIFLGVSIVLLAVAVWWTARRVS